MSTTIVIVALTGFFAVPVSSDEETPVRIDSPVAPEDSIAHMEAHPDVRIDLVACEPNVVDPVAIKFDEFGRLWVVEMHDYPLGSPEGQPTSQIKILLDEDDDGFYEIAHLFADNLTFANGIEPWRGGVIVTSSGKVSWMKDTDGDFHADVDETWFTGFAEENTQLRANDPTFAIDNHIYISNGLRGGVVVTAKEDWKAANPEPIQLRGRDFRFDPLTGKAEAVTGNGQFGQTFDAFGNRFVCTNRNPAKHIVFQQKELERNPHLAAVETVHDAATAGADSRVFPITNAWTTSNLHAGTFTAACGVTVYTGTALPREFSGNIFTCDPTGSLVHREVLTPHGVTFKGRPGREGVEFLASRDPWFRPVNLANGPDGALYVVDMYRAVIEHPQFMPEELKNSPDHRRGDDRGRIYRLRGTEARRITFESPDIDDIDALQPRTFWDHSTVRRLVYESQDATAVQSLMERFGAVDGFTQIPALSVSDAYQLHVLKGVGQLTDEILLGALRQPTGPFLRANAIQLARPRFDTSSELWKAVVNSRSRLAPEPFPIVQQIATGRLQLDLTLSLGDIPPSPERDQVLEEILLTTSNDQWMRLAGLSSLGDQSAAWVPKLMHGVMAKERVSRGDLELLREVAICAGTEGDADKITHIVNESGIYESLIMQLTVVDGIESGLERRGRSLNALASQPPMLKRDLEQLVTDARRKLQENGDNSMDRFGEIGDSQRLLIRLLGIVQNDSARTALLAKLDATSEVGEQSMLLESLAKHQHDDVTNVLLSQLPSATPGLRSALMNAVLRDGTRIKAMYAAIDAEEIHPRILDVPTLQRLSRSGDAEIADRAKSMIAESVDSNRTAVVEKYLAQLSKEADPVHGRKLFKQHCSVCHRVGDLGTDVAPDISDSRTKTHEYLLTHILDPNRVVDAGYFGYTLLTTDGRSAVGIVAAETATSLTLKQADGKTTTVPKDDIEECVSTGMSLMPVGLEKAIPPDDMSAVVSFLKNWRYLSGESPKPVP